MLLHQISTDLAENQGPADGELMRMGNPTISAHRWGYVTHRFLVPLLFTFCIGTFLRSFTSPYAVLAVVSHQPQTPISGPPTTQDTSAYHVSHRPLSDMLSSHIPKNDSLDPPILSHKPPSYPCIGQMYLAPQAIKSRSVSQPPSKSKSPFKFGLWVRFEPRATSEPTKSLWFNAITATGVGCECQIQPENGFGASKRGHHHRHRTCHGYGIVLGEDDGIVVVKCVVIFTARIKEAHPKIVTGR